ncbi:MAG: hypothetical protein CL886_03350 [Dehalococcoidia bacterium]|nr:hypothetical protein [Dehalococcoidia bacterium]|tara:strand:+ start:966 stop:2246 length:1281 start_codon:yes stop_codon:yes gene_type:complete
MADMELVQTVKQGRDAVAKWREDHPGEILDLYQCFMSHVRIPMVDLRGADMRDGDFMGAMMRRANLAGSYLNPAHLYRSDLREADLSRTLLNSANLRGADLRGAILEGADADQAIFSDANLEGANLSGANFSRVNFTGANLTNANLSGTNLNGADLKRANLTGAIMDGADLYEAVLNDVPTTGTNFAGCIIGYTVFQNCDMSEALGLNLIRHDAPSTVGMDTFFRSAGNLPSEFLQGIGLPSGVLEYQNSITRSDGVNSEYYISCTESDVPFAEKMRDDLRSQGVRVWVFAENFRGNALVDRRSTSEEEEIERWVRHYDKLIVVCSQASFENEIVRTDLTQAKDLQTLRDEWLVYLVDPDGSLDKPSSRAARNLKAEHIVFDLQGQEGDSDNYKSEISRLSDGLKKDQPAKAGIPAFEGGGNNLQL